jgi:hypothetical protein
VISESGHCQRSCPLLNEFSTFLEPLNDILVSDANGRREEPDDPVCLHAVA